MSDAKLQITRKQLAAFLSDPDAIKVFEQMLSVVDDLKAASPLGAGWPAALLAPVFSGIVESNPLGRYIKCGDGTMVQWGRTGALTVDTAYGGGYFSGSAYVQPTFSPSFLVGSTPYCFCTPIDTSGGWCWLSATGGLATPTVGPQVRAFSFVNGFNVKCEWFAIGRWK